MALSKLDSLYMAVVADHSKIHITKGSWKMLSKLASIIQPVGMSSTSLSSLTQRTVWKILLF